MEIMMCCRYNTLLEIQTGKNIRDFIRDSKGIKCFNRLKLFVKVALVEDIVRFDGFLVCLSLIPGNKNAVRNSHTNVKAVDFV